MDLIRIFCDINDIKFKNLLNHFLRYMAVYIEEIYSWGEERKNESLVDIFIISKYYTEVSVDIEIEKKAILILTDGYDVDERYGVHKIVYENYSQEEDFLSELLDQINDILVVRKKFENRLIFQSAVVGKDGITKVYAGNHIFESSILARHFFENRERLEWILVNYKNYINDLNNLFEKNKSDLIKYAISYAMYEADVACKKHSYELLYSPECIVANCLELMKRYEDNTEICLLIADVHFELMDSWAKAANEYGNAHLMYCAYAHYKRGRILRKYADDIDNAIISIKNALELNPAYYNAWYQYAMCYNEKNDYEREIYALQKIYFILKVKRSEGISSPIELEYLYKTILQMKQLITEMHVNIDFGEEIELRNVGEGYAAEMNLTETVPEKHISSNVLINEFSTKVSEIQMERCM